jgi:hypothetical protein
MAEEYTRKEDAVYDIYQRFADKDIGECPFCQNKEPKWLYREEWKLLGNNSVYFKCPCCESELMVPKDDITGLSFSKASSSGKKKARQGKVMNEPYVTVIKIGFEYKNAKNMLLVGEEMTVSQLKKRADEMRSV